MKKVLFLFLLVAVALVCLKSQLFFDNMPAFTEIQWMALITPNGMSFSLFVSFLLCLAVAFNEYKARNYRMARAAQSRDSGVLHYLKNRYSDLATPLFVFWRCEIYYLSIFYGIVVIALTSTYNLSFIYTYCIGATIYTIIIYIFRTALLDRLVNRYKDI